MKKDENGEDYLLKLAKISRAEMIQIEGCRRDGTVVKVRRSDGTVSDALVFEHREVFQIQVLILMTNPPLWKRVSPRDLITENPEVFK